MLEELSDLSVIFIWGLIYHISSYLILVALYFILPNTNL